MAGRHEPPSKRSFWISLTTSVMKWLVVAPPSWWACSSWPRVRLHSVLPVTPVASPIASTAVALTRAAGPPSRPRPEPTSDFSGHRSWASVNGTTTPKLAGKAEKPAPGGGLHHRRTLQHDRGVDVDHRLLREGEGHGCRGGGRGQPSSPTADVLEYPKGPGGRDAATGATGPPNQGHPGRRVPRC